VLHYPYQTLPRPGLSSIVRLLQLLSLSKVYLHHLLAVLKVISYPLSIDFFDLRWCLFRSDARHLLTFWFLQLKRWNMVNPSRSRCHVEIELIGCFVLCRVFTLLQKKSTQMEKMYGLMLNMISLNIRVLIYCFYLCENLIHLIIGLQKKLRFSSVAYAVWEKISMLFKNYLEQKQQVKLSNFITHVGKKSVHYQMWKQNKNSNVQPLFKRANIFSTSPSGSSSNFPTLSSSSSSSSASSSTTSPSFASTQFSS